MARANLAALLVLVSLFVFMAFKLHAIEKDTISIRSSLTSLTKANPRIVKDSDAWVRQRISEGATQEEILKELGGMESSQAGR